jgi:hypothetical protein
MNQNLKQLMLERFQKLFLDKIKTKMKSVGLLKILQLNEIMKQQRKILLFYFYFNTKFHFLDLMLNKQFNQILKFNYFHQLYQKRQVDIISYKS